MLPIRSEMFTPIHSNELLLCSQSLCCNAGWQRLCVPHTVAALTEPVMCIKIIMCFSVWFALVFLIVS